MNDYHFEISFRVTHPTLSATDVCSMLGMDTEVKRDVGGVRQNVKGKILPGTWKETYCGFEVPRVAQDTIPECIENMLRLLDDKQAAIFRLRGTGGSFAFYVLATPTELTMGEKLDSELLAKLGRLGIDISLEVHWEPSRNLSPD